MPHPFPSAAPRQRAEEACQINSPGRMRRGNCLATIDAHQILCYTKTRIAKIKFLCKISGSQKGAFPLHGTIGKPGGKRREQSSTRSAGRNQPTRLTQFYPIV
jgi:hypothetical protein